MRVAFALIAHRTTGDISTTHRIDERRNGALPPTVASVASGRYGRTLRRTFRTGRRSTASRTAGPPGGTRKAPTTSTPRPSARTSSRSTRRRRPSAVRCTSATCSATPTPTPSPATSAWPASRSSTRWGGTTTASRPSAGSRRTTACVAIRPCPTTPASSRRSAVTRPRSTRRSRSHGRTSSNCATNSSRSTRNCSSGSSVGSA